MPAHRHEDLTPNDDRRVARRGYLLGNAFQAWVSIAAVLTGIVFLAEPAALENSAIAAAAGVFAVAWGVLYSAGGLLSLAGLIAAGSRYDIEVAGLSLLTAASLIDGCALLATRGSAGLRIVLIYLSLAAASMMRAYLVLRLARIGAEFHDD